MSLPVSCQQEELQDSFVSALPKRVSKVDIEREIGGQKCQQCSYTGRMIKQHKLGFTAYSWVICLACFTLVFFWLPLVCERCKDCEEMCPECGTITDREYADCL